MKVWLVGWLGVVTTDGGMTLVNLAEVSRMDYNCDVTELAINPTFLYFFGGSLVGFSSFFFFFRGEFSGLKESYC